MQKFNTYIVYLYIIWMRLEPCTPCISGNAPIKISADAPLTSILHLERLNASRVPALGCSWKNLFKQRFLLRIEYFTAVSGHCAFISTCPLVEITKRFAFTAVVARKNHIFVFTKWTVQNAWSFALKRILRTIDFKKPISIITRNPKFIGQHCLAVRCRRQTDCDYQNQIFHFCAENDVRDVETVAVSRLTSLPCSTNSWLEFSIADRWPITASKPNNAAPVARAVRMPAYTYAPIEKRKIEENALSVSGSEPTPKLTYNARPSTIIPPIMKIKPVTLRMMRSNVMGNLYACFFQFETNNLGSYDNPVVRGSSHDKLVLVTAPSQGGGGQFTPSKAATFQSKYAIINSILRDQVDRSEA